MNCKLITILAILFLTVANRGQLKAQNSERNKSVNQFSFDLYHEVKLEKGNVFLSPLSTYYALLSIYEGSENKTKAAFEKVLYLKDSSFSKNDNLHEFALKTDSLSSLKVSNAIWLDKRFQEEAVFRNVVSAKYGSDFKQTDFKNTEQAVSDINSWVADKTNQRITNMISPSEINSKTKLMILNAVYFKGEWLNKFEKLRTAESTFFTDNENQYKTDFMNITEKLNYFENEAFQFINKPYKDSDLSFCILLPKELYGLEDIEESLNADFLNEILEKTATKKVWLSMPKIKMEESYKLKSALTNMGLNIVFTNDADFSGITKKESINIEQVSHKSYIDLNEDHTEAATATTTTTFITGAPSYTSFKADHPFLFFIVDNKTKAMVFMGRYEKPQGGEIVDKANFVDNLLKRNRNKLDWSDNDKILILISDGKKMKKVDIQDVNFNDIERLEVYKNDDVKKYTTEDYYGVVVLTVKKNKKSTK